MKIPPWENVSDADELVERNSLPGKTIVLSTPSNRRILIGKGGVFFDGKTLSPIRDEFLDRRFEAVFPEWKPPKAVIKIKRKSAARSKRKASRKARAKQRKSH